ncbi:UBX domain-containing protein [Colletotrichum karsti]|uniref:UBX domain-containing protein n=1 Tax=Colletotrichum karsti TaxID=1095194 RepID=A0A9P6HZX4_9PEZI|nr:UBX domain-containing protein [Colletotrichum karsti]KAF9873948.1 UBX domain-containing protein [Colletotrichum karsti]
MDGDISNFVAITAASPEVARGFLEMANNNLEAAIQLFFENPDIQNSFNAAPAASSSAAPPVPASTRPNIGRQDNSGVIHLDSDDDEDTAMYDDDDGLFVKDDFKDDDEVAARAAEVDAHAQATAIAQKAQEEEDAAMAQRLQEELYGSGAGGGAGGGGAAHDEVRSPIARTTETLVGGYDADDGMGMDMDSIIRAQMRQREAARAGRGGRGGPFSHNLSIWDDDGSTPQQPATSEGASRAQRLAELFRPPYDIMSRLDWDEARQEGKDEKKWILVNLQDMSDFNCQALNRDIWKDAAIRQLLAESFIFLQYDKDSVSAQQYVTFYFHHGAQENPDNYPHVAIIDPRTGEQVKVWSGRPFPSASDFHAQLAEFLDRYSLAANSKNPVADQSAPRPKTVDVDRMTEEEMLEMALQNSLQTSNGGSSSDAKPKAGVVDPDALTKSDSSSEKGKAPADEASTPAAETSAPPSIWTTIASDKPHTEPENNPATTTRIQFRHPTGRVIRRFNVFDPVRRIYEWLKAEPLEGKGGIEFELKRMPQGQDLTAELDKTIAEAGLKQGTVMIEFIED